MELKQSVEKRQFAALLSLPLFIAAVLVPPGRISWQVVWILSHLNTYMEKSKWMDFHPAEQTHAC